jgi:hypothetical protein
MVGFLIIGVLVVISVAVILLTGRSPRADDRGGFEQHPGVSGGWPAGPLH